MQDNSFTLVFTVPQTPAEVFAAINDVKLWWGGSIEGITDRQGESFTYRYEQMHRSTQLITELVPDRRVVWHVTDAELSFVDDGSEWAGTDIIFDVIPKDGQTEVHFTHQGLQPKLQCFQDCSGGWTHYVGSSLRGFIASRTLAA